MHPSLLLVCSRRGKKAQARLDRDERVKLYVVPLRFGSFQSQNSRWTPCAQEPFQRRRKRGIQTQIFKYSKVLWDVIISPMVLWRRPRCDGPALCQTEHLRSHLPIVGMCSLSPPPVSPALPPSFARLLSFFPFIPGSFFHAVIAIWKRSRRSCTASIKYNIISQDK